MCDVCSKESSWSWTDTHGIAQCRTCGSPHRIYHYGDGNKRIDREPTLLVSDKALPFVRRYWEETGKRIPGGYSFPGGQELCSEDEQREFYDWWKHNAEPELVGQQS